MKKRSCRVLFIAFVCSLVCLFASCELANDIQGKKTLKFVNETSWIMHIKVYSEDGTHDVTLGSSGAVLGHSDKKELTIKGDVFGFTYDNQNLVSPKIDGETITFTSKRT